MKTTKVILIKDCKPIGKKNDIVEVNSGYAENFLIPNKIAIKYTEFGLKKLNEELAEKASKKEHDISLEMQVKEKLEEKLLLIKLKSHNKKAIGGVNPSSLSKEVLKQLNVEINKASFLNKSSINTFGEFIRSIKLPHGTICNIKIKVEEDNE